jgi:hypothetical protein
MISKISENKLHAFDAKTGLKNQNILLILDRCITHPLNMQFKNIKLAFFPAICTSELQPLDLGIIHSFKLNLIQKVVTLLYCGKDPRQMKISMLDALHYISKLWNEVKVSTISNSFRKAGLCLENSEVILQETHESSILDADWEHHNSVSTFSNFVEVDAGVLTCEQTIDDVLDQHVSHVSEGGSFRQRWG